MCQRYHAVGFVRFDPPILQAMWKIILFIHHIYGILTEVLHTAYNVPAFK